MAIQNHDCAMQLASGLTCLLGDLMAVDMTKVDTSLHFYEMRAPVTADFLTATTAANVQPYMAIALETQANAAGIARFRFKGQVAGLIDDTTLAIGAKLTAKNASRALDTQATAAGTGNRCLAILKEATTAASQIKDVDFDGMSGVIAGGFMVTNAS